MTILRLKTSKLAKIKQLIQCSSRSKARSDLTSVLVHFSLASSCSMAYKYCAGADTGWRSLGTPRLELGKKSHLCLELSLYRKSIIA